VKKRGLVILGVVVLLGVWAMVIGYEFLEKENALWQKKVKAAKDEQRRCEARNSKYRNFDQFRTSIRIPYTSDLPPERWMQQFNTLRAGMSEPEVEIILGAPDYAQCVLSKEGDRFIGSTWEYAVVVLQDAANDGQNSGIRVFFGPDVRLKDKNAVNMQPSPAPRATPTASATPAGTPAQDATPLPPATPGSNATPAVVPSTPSGIAPQQAIPSPTATPSPVPSPGF